MQHQLEAHDENTVFSPLIFPIPRYPQNFFLRFHTFLSPDCPAQWKLLRPASMKGYAVTTKGSKYSVMDNVKVLQMSYLHCCKSGTYCNRGTGDKGKKDTSSRLVDCPFYASIRHQNEGYIYILMVENPDHNYEPVGPIALPQHCEPGLKPRYMVDQVLPTAEPKAHQSVKPCDQNPTIQ